MSRRSKIWLFVLLVLATGQAIAALTLRRGFALTAISDLTQCIVLLSAVLAYAPNAQRTHGRTRIFWALMAVALALWLSYQLIWTCFEVYLRKDVPDIFSGDIVLFLHIVPMMGALALQPQRQQDDRTATFGSLDFAVLLIWWVYLFLYSVIPWQYVVPNQLHYSHNLNATYLTEKAVFIGGLVLVWIRSSPAWRAIYGHLFGASVSYALTSYLANWAIETHRYYTGSLYDVPLVVSMAWFTVVALLARDRVPKSSDTRSGGDHGVWIARLGMVTILSLPLFAAWELLDQGPPARVRMFRVVVTFGTMVVMGAMVFLKQHLLDRELLRLLQTSRNSLADLSQLQTQLVESEKLASLGQLVGGAAHELNNPLTAMLGYAELLSSTELDPEQRTLAQRIGRQVRKTKSLVASLLSFARQVPGEKSAVDICALVQTAVKHCQPQAGPGHTMIQSRLGDSPLVVLGDSNQLLQVCLHIINNAVLAMEEDGGGILTIATQRRNDWIMVEFWEDGPTGHEAGRVFDPFHTTRPAGQGMGLGLSACYGIVQEHSGKIFFEKRPEGGTVFRIELPEIAPAVAKRPGDLRDQVSTAAAAGDGGTVKEAMPENR